MRHIDYLTTVYIRANTHTCAILFMIYFIEQYKMITQCLLCSVVLTLHGHGITVHYPLRNFSILHRTLQHLLFPSFQNQVHPSRKYFAVAEKGVKPDINIFEYPSLKLHRVLREGTEEAYANLDFSPNGTQLASVGSAPDFMMTIWDWKKEKVSLRSKAFAQDIYQVAFSPDNEGHITTGGSGHIRQTVMMVLVMRNDGGGDGE